MGINRKKAAAVAVASVLTLGMFAGCDLVTQNEAKNLQQTVAEVNITDTESFKTEFAGLDETLVSKVISTATVSKRDMIASFVGSGYSVMSSYGWTYKDTFDAISDSLVQRQVYIQYAKAYFLKNGWTDEDGTPYTYNNLAAFNNAVADEEGVEYDIAVLSYFLTEREEAKALYSTRVMFNNSIDSLETQFIEEKEDENDYDSDVRTTPTGLNTSNSDYYSEDYMIYTGTGKQSGVHVYEPKDGSTTTTRHRAYDEMLTRLKSNRLVQKGEDTSDIESLAYFKLEYKSDLEDALIQKLTDTFTEQAEKKITKEYLENKFDTTLANQREIYAKSSSSLESDLDSVSDSYFVLTATGNKKSESAYGFVINILLPFSAAQSGELSAVNQDFGDLKGNKFLTRAKLLQKIRATDQRGSWFRGETDYSFKATSAKTAYGYNTTDDSKWKREWLFFEDNLKESENESELKYDRLKNYYGQYTYNGTWDEEARKYKPNQITIDDFINEMEGYLEFANLTVEKSSVDKDYYKRSYYYTATEDGHKEGDVDYSQFIYYKGKVSFNGKFDANNIFKAGTQENIALSVINELSFAYNTDTGGLNSYLGYAVTANKTSFVSEFEYAAQLVVKEGAGNYIVVPSDYGWHVIYCTFSFVDSVDDSEDQTGIRTPYAFNYDSREDEGTFSNLFYESYKADTASKESSNLRSKIISSYKESYTVYENRYKDLTDLDNN